MEVEYKLMTVLAEERLRLTNMRENIDARLSFLDAKIKETSFYWIVGEDGFLEMGLGIFLEPLDADDE